MKKILALLSVMFMFSIVANAQNTIEPASNPNAPVINFEKTTHNYGTVVKGGDGTCEFKFKNTGIEPLILSNVSSSCGCTVPEWPREPILRGKSAIIKVKYDTNRIGAINKSVTVMSNATVSSIRLQITGNVVDASSESQMPLNNPTSAPVAK